MLAYAKIRPVARSALLHSAVRAAQRAQIADALVSEPAPCPTKVPARRSPTRSARARPAGRSSPTTSSLYEEKKEQLGMMHRWPRRRVEQQASFAVEP